MASGSHRERGSTRFTGAVDIDTTLNVDGATTFAVLPTVAGLKPVTYVYGTYVFGVFGLMVDRTVFIADVPMTLVSIQESHQVAESAGTLAIVPMRCQGVEAPASGDVLVTGGFNGVATAETVQNGTIVTAADIHKFAAGNRLGIDFTGDVAGELAGVTITYKFSID